MLVRAFGDIDLAEECVQEAFATAVARWPVDGVPPAPAGWIITTARNKALDRLRRESVRDDRQAEALRLAESHSGRDPVPEEGPVLDDRLRLIFTCCHPALAPSARVALTLRLLGGLTTAEIARAFLVPEATMAQRLVRAKGKIKAARIPYRVPHDADLPERLRGVLAVVYLVFNEGYTASGGASLVRDDLCHEAIRLGRLLVELMPDEPEAVGLLALMLLAAARREARDRRRRAARPAAVTRSRPVGRRARRRGSRPRAGLPAPGIGPARTRSRRRSRPCTPTCPPTGAQVVALYDQLLALAPTPVAALNRAVAVAEVEGPAAALALVEPLPLERLHVYHARARRPAAPPRPVRRGRRRLRRRGRVHVQRRRGGVPRGPAG